VQALLFFAVLIVCFLLIPLAGAGMALINTGLGRSRNAAHAMFTSICAIASAACAWVVVGQSIAGWNGGPARTLLLGGKAWNWIGASGLFMTGLPATNSPALLVALFGVLTAGLMALIPLGAGAERWRLGAVCASSAMLGGIVYPLFLHWAWNGGWLARNGFIDVGGSGVLHGVGGMAALATAWQLGPRHGKYTSDGMPLAMPGHHGIFVLFGCLLSLPGWIAVNVTAAMLFHAVDPGLAVVIAMNTVVAASAAALAAALLTRIRFGKPDLSLTANGWVAGIAAIAAGCASVPPVSAIVIGLCAGALAPLSVELLELRLKIDDPGGSISVHAVGGIWGLIALALLGRLPGANGNLFFAQLAGIATLLGCILPLIFGLNSLLDRVLPFRAPADGERQGMDIHELGAGAYPEFMTHTDEFMPR
jgi:Amt family ammonium transporter